MHSSHAPNSLIKESDDDESKNEMNEEGSDDSDYDEVSEQLKPKSRRRAYRSRFLENHHED
jgi:hypothetical protein